MRKGDMINMRKAFKETHGPFLWLTHLVCSDYGSANSVAVQLISYILSLQYLGAGNKAISDDNVT